jgi:branched-chain amino acid transport system permease protein
MYVVLISCLNIIVGYVGQVSLAHPAFYGMGAYISAILSTDTRFPFPGIFVLSGIFPAIAAYGLGVLSIKLRGIYFVMVSLAFTIIVYFISNNWVGLTRGPMGIVNIPYPKIALPFFPELVIRTSAQFYYFILILTIVTVLFVTRLVRSRIGSFFVAVRENEDLAESLGINIYKYKLIAFVLTAVFAGWAGSFYCYYIRAVTPQITDFYYIVTFFIMLIAGGKGTVAGPILGAIIFSFIPEYLRITAYLRDTVYGLLLIVTIYFLPDGIWPRVVEIFKRK